MCYYLEVSRVDSMKIIKDLQTKRVQLIDSRSLQNQVCSYGSSAKSKKKKDQVVKIISKKDDEASISPAIKKQKRKLQSDIKVFKRSRSINDFMNLFQYEKTLAKEAQPEQHFLYSEMLKVFECESLNEFDRILMNSIKQFSDTRDSIYKQTFVLNLLLKNFPDNLNENNLNQFVKFIHLALRDRDPYRSSDKIIIDLYKKILKTLTKQVLEVKDENIEIFQKLCLGIIKEFKDKKQNSANACSYFKILYARLNQRELDDESLFYFNYEADEDLRSKVTLPSFGEIYKEPYSQLWVGISVMDKKKAEKWFKSEIARVLT